MASRPLFQFLPEGNKSPVDSQTGPILYTLHPYNQPQCDAIFTSADKATKELTCRVHMDFKSPAQYMKHFTMTCSNT